jgi:hypothetical protein
MLGIHDLKAHITVTQTRVECPVAGCRRSVERQRRPFRRDERFQCLDHRIYISPSTFEYEHDTDNLLWTSEADLALLQAVKMAKRESRMARDNSEDALSWNVFRYLETAGLLGGLLSRLTQHEESPTELVYWSYSQLSCGAWPVLNRARKEFGEHLARSSEPDLLAVSPSALFFIEAKLTAGNETTPSDPNNRKKYLTGGDRWFEQVFATDYETVAIRARKYELFRFWLLGSWLAEQIGRAFYLVNLVPAEREVDIEQRFRPHIRTAPERQFKRLSWEEIYAYIAGNAPDSEGKKAVMAYFENKSMGYDQRGNIRKAFRIDKGISR